MHDRKGRDDELIFRVLLPLWRKKPPIQWVTWAISADISDQSVDMTTHV